MTGRVGSVNSPRHMGETVKHRSRVVRHPPQPNLPQVHLIDLPGLPAGARLRMPKPTSVNQ